jgi:hypothetical protein
VPVEVLKIDVDSSLLEVWKEDYIWSRIVILQALGFMVKDVQVRPSGEALPWKESNKKGKGFHIWFHVESLHPMSDLKRLRLQFLLGDDPGRSWINYLRITKRHNPLWNKIFGYITWRSPQDPRCKQCRLLVLLDELKAGEKNGKKED